MIEESDEKLLEIERKKRAEKVAKI